MLSLLLLLMMLSFVVQAAEVQIAWTSTPQAVYQAEVGDVVVFTYSTSHDIFLGGSGCSGGTLLCNTTQGSNAACKLRLDKSGDISIYCGVFQHCAAGMHSIIRVFSVTMNTFQPTRKPTTAYPTRKPTTAKPTTAYPTRRPTTAKPTLQPTAAPTLTPTLKPTTPYPTRRPTRTPTRYPTKPTRKPTRAPSRKPTTAYPTTQ